jgi:hypothetical protein
MKKRTDIILIIIILFIAFALLGLEMINGRFQLNDFKVYYLASKAFLDSQQIYGVPFGLESGIYKYSPFFLVLFLPFTFQDFTNAGIIYYSIIALALVFIFLVSRRIIYKYFNECKITNETLILLLSLVFIANPVYREFHMGNINFVLLLLILGTLFLILKEKPLAGGILFGVAALIKPYLLFICLVLILRKKWKTLYGVAGVIILQFLLFILIYGFGKSVEIHQAWVSAIFDHSATFQGGNDLAYLVHIYTKSTFDPLISYLAIVLAAMVLIIIDIDYRRNLKDSGEKPRNDNQIFISEWFLGIAFIPTIFNADTQLFLLSLPVIMISLYYIFIFRNRLLAVLTGVAFLFFGLNSNDLVGDSIGNFFDKVGAVGISNLLILTIAIIVFRTYNSGKANSLNTLSARHKK